MNTKKISPFQIGIFIACGIGIVFAVLIFSDKIKIGGPAAEELGGMVTMWGTLPFVAVKNTTDYVTQMNKNIQIQYSQKDSKTFQLELVNALASGVGPDLVMLSSDGVIANKDRLFVVPFTSLSQETYQSTFIDQGSLFMRPDGVLAFPFIVDPLVMFYNKDLLASSFTVDAPKTWDDVIALNEKLTKKDDAMKLVTQTVALGTYANITHAKDIILALIFQVGNPVVAWNQSSLKYESTLGSSSGGLSAADAFRFYTLFSNSTSDRYSWNTELPNDKNQFIAGKLAMYFGFASEIENLRSRNPNLNFGVALFPQRKESSKKSTLGHLTGVAVMKASKNPTLALTVAKTLVSKDTLDVYLKESSHSAPARRDMLGVKNDSALQTTIYNSAIISQGFLDPDAVQTNAFFQKITNQVNAGLVGPESILSSGNSLLGDLLEKIQK